MMMLLLAAVVAAAVAKVFVDNRFVPIDIDKPDLWESMSDFSGWVGWYHLSNETMNLAVGNYSDRLPASDTNRLVVETHKYRTKSLWRMIMVSALFFQLQCENWRQ